MNKRRVLMQVLVALAFFGFGFWFGQLPGSAERVGDAKREGMSSADDSSVSKATPLAELWAEEAELREKIKSLMGPVPEWPEHPPRELTPAYFNEIVVGDLSAVLGVEAAMNDCVQFPCMATFAMPLAEREEALILDVVELRNGLFQEWGKDRVAWASEWGVYSDSAGQDWFMVTVAIAPEGASEGFEQRLAARAVLQKLALRREFGLVE